MNNLKTCNRCHKEKAFNCFSPHAAGKGGVKARCKACLRDQYQETKPDPETHYLQNRVSWLKTRYGMTVEDYNTRLAEQGGRCAICGSINPGKPRNFCVDHDHSCCPGKISCGKCIRGLVCDRCNIVLGRVQDNPTTLRSAASYLESWING